MGYDILIAGVGGQGTILASRLLANAAMVADRFVRTGETIGMAQRGGSVVSHVRINSREVSPYIPFGSADLLLSFEYAEAARNANRLKPDGRMLVNTQRVYPTTVTSGGAIYDEEKMAPYIDGALMVDGYHLAQRAGSVKSINVVLLGAALLPLTKDDMREAIRQSVRETFWELNFNALEMGCEYARKATKNL